MSQRETGNEGDGLEEANARRAREAVETAGNRLARVLAELLCGSELEDLLDLHELAYVEPHDRLGYLAAARALDDGWRVKAWAALRAYDSATRGG